MKRAKRFKLVEEMWQLEDSADRVEAAFDELVDRRKEVMEELVRSSQKELAKTLMHLLEFEKVTLTTEEMSEFTRIGQIGDNHKIKKKNR